MMKKPQRPPQSDDSLGQGLPSTSPPSLSTLHSGAGGPSEAADGALADDGPVESGVSSPRFGAPVAVASPSARYRDLRVIASGATASVSEAYDELMHRHVAIKRVHSDVIESTGSEKFHREALLASWLEHPNILPIYDIFPSPSGAPELVMRLVDGRTLSDVIGEEDRSPRERCCASRGVPGTNCSSCSTESWT